MLSSTRANMRASAAVRWGLLMTPFRHQAAVEDQLDLLDALTRLGVELDVPAVASVATSDHARSTGPALLEIVGRDDGAVADGEVGHQVAFPALASASSIWSRSAFWSRIGSYPGSSVGMLRINSSSGLPWSLGSV